MSMLSGFTSNLRDLAGEINHYGNCRSLAGPTILPAVTITEVQNALREAADIIDTLRDMNNGPSMGNEKLRALVRKNYYLTMSERDALRQACYDDDTYLKALDAEIMNAKNQMCELGIEVDA